MVDLVVNSRYLGKLFFGGRRGEFVIVIEVDGMGVLAIQTAVDGILIYRIGCGVVGNLSKYQPSFPIFLSIIAENTEVLFEYLDSLFTKSVSL